MAITPKKKTTTKPNASGQAAPSGEQCFIDIVAYVHKNEANQPTINSLIAAGLNAPEVHACIRRHFIVEKSSKALRVTEDGLAFAGLKVPHVAQAKTVHDFVALLYIKGIRHPIDHKLRDQGFDYSVMTEAVTKGWAKKSEEGSFKITKQGRTQAQFVIGMKLRQLAPAGKKGGKPSQVIMGAAMIELGLGDRREAWRMWEAVAEFVDETSDAGEDLNMRTGDGSGVKLPCDSASDVPDVRIGESAGVVEDAPTGIEPDGASVQTWTPPECLTEEDIELGKKLRERYQFGRPIDSDLKQAAEELGVDNLARARYCHEAMNHIGWLCNTSAYDCNMHGTSMVASDLPAARAALRIVTKLGEKTKVGHITRLIKRLEREAQQAAEAATDAPESPSDAPDGRTAAGNEASGRKRRATAPANGAQMPSKRQDSSTQPAKKTGRQAGKSQPSADEDIPPLSAWIAPICTELDRDKDAGGVTAKQLLAWATRAWAENCGWRTTALNTQYDEHHYLKRTLIKRLHRFTEASETHPIIPCVCTHGDVAAIGYSGGYASCFCPECKHPVRFSFNGHVTHCESDQTIRGRQTK